MITIINSGTSWLATSLSGAPPPALASQIASKGETYAYAELGLWYDAFASVSDLIDADPQSDSSREMRASLLRQVGLGEIASAH